MIVDKMTVGKMIVDETNADNMIIRKMTMHKIKL